jgi:predicted ATP-grasp superfamily ATP-dependent carboligase
MSLNLSPSVRRNVLVTDGEERSALAVVRSLGNAGHRVLVTSRSGRSLAGASRHSEADLSLPSPLKDPEAYATAVRNIVTTQGIDTLIPMTEAALLALLPKRDLFEGVLIPFPDLPAFQAVSNKQAVLDAAGAVGISVPSQIVLESPEDARRLDPRTIPLPVVLKPSRSVVGGSSNRRKVGVLHAASVEQLEQRLRSVPEEAFPLMLQQRIVGPGVGIFLLLWEGQVRAAFSHRRLREKPPSGGVSVYRESIPADPALVEKSKALLDHFDWEGVAMIEYKVDAATNTPYLMEINGRFWGSLQLPIDAGVDFPSLLLECACGNSPRPVTDYRVGTRSRWWWGEVDHLIMRLRYKAEELSLAEGSPGRFRALVDFLARHRLDREEIFRLSDPKPFLTETRNWFRRA